VWISDERPNVENGQTLTILETKQKIGEEIITTYRTPLNQILGVKVRK
jgi:hypothetical protein